MSIAATSILQMPFRELAFRTLRPDDAVAYQRLRVKAITEKDRRFFYINPEEELSQSSGDWRAVCTETCDRAMFGAFVGDKLVGAMSATIWDSDATGKTAYFRAAYVLPEVRHTSITKTLCTMHDNWATEHGCEKAVYAIRSDNTCWIEKQIKNGAKIIADEPMRFADGTTAQTYWLERRLEKLRT